MKASGWHSRVVPRTAQGGQVHIACAAADMSSAFPMVTLMCGHPQGALPVLPQGLLPPEAQDHELVRQKLTWALNAMNSAMDGVPLQYAQPEPAPNVGAGYAYAGAAGMLFICACPRLHLQMTVIQLISPAAPCGSMDMHTPRKCQLPRVHRFSRSVFLCTPGQCEFCAAHAWGAKTMLNH